MLSFVIPVYNSEDTIKRCIDSIIAQKSNIDFEVVVVDDGSSDKTGKIVSSYVDDRVKYFFKINGGVASARNYGISKAKGDYIIFVDSDDYISNSLLNDIELYIKSDIDLIKWNPTIVKSDDNANELVSNDIENNNIYENANNNNYDNDLDNNKNINFEKTNNSKKEFKTKIDIISGEDGFNRLYGSDPLLDCLWNYAIKKSIIPKFPEGTYHEDFAIMPIIMLSAKTMIIIDEYEYYYVQTTDSIMRNNDVEKTHKKLQDILQHYDSLMDSIKKMKLQKETIQNVGIFCTNSLLVIIPNLSNNDKKFFEKELKKRRISKNIKIRNFKQLIKRLLLNIKY